LEFESFLVKKYKYKSDFVSFFLESPLTKEPEYEVRISARREQVVQYQNMLKRKQIFYRQVGLEIFPPPVRFLIDSASFKEAMAALIIWHNENRTRNLGVTLMQPTGDLINVRNEEDMQKILEEEVA